MDELLELDQGCGLGGVANRPGVFLFFIGSSVNSPNRLTGLGLRGN